MRPSDRDIRIAAGAVILVGLAACAVGIFSKQLGLAGDVARGRFWWENALLVLGGLLLVTGAMLAARPRDTPWADLSDRRLGHLAIGLLALLGLTLVWTRLVHIDHSFWRDEAFTVLNFSGVGPGAILFGDFHWNNHVGYNFLSWATVGLLGESEATYRLWSVVPGIAAIGIATWWAWERIGRVAAVAFATIAVAGPLHLDVVPQARGYGLALLAATLTLIAADRLTRAYSRRTLLGFLGAGLLGIWTFVAFAIAFLGQALALLRWPHLRLPMIAALGGAGVLAAAIFAPMFGGVDRAARVAATGVQGEPVPLAEGLLLFWPLEWLVIPTVTMLIGREASDASWVIYVAVLALLLLGLVALWRRGARGLALLLLVPPLLFNLALSLGEQGTVPRHQLILLPYIVLPVAVGIAEIGRIAARRQATKAVAIVTGVAAALILPWAIVATEADRSLPRENFKQVSEVVERTGIDTVVTDSRRPEGLRYYLGDDLIEVPSTALEPLLCEPGQEVVYIHHLAFTRWSPARLGCIESKPMDRVRVPQRGDGFAIDVWITAPQRGAP